MKVSEIVTEGLRGNWSIPRIRELTGRQITALKTNATNASDNDVLSMIKTVENERYEIQKQAAADKRYDARMDNPTKYINKDDLQKIAMKIEMTMGDVFPDGDPIDKLGPWLQKNYHLERFDIMKILDKACKTLGKYKGYHDYLASNWDSYSEMYLDGNPGLKDEHPDNPWR